MWEEIKKYEGCLDNKEKVYKECRTWQLKRKVLGVIPKNYINRETEIIDFYTDRSLDKGEDRENIGVGWVGIDQIENSIVSIENLKVVN